MALVFRRESDAAKPDVCHDCGAGISRRGLPRHRQSFRCYARSGLLRRDGWTLATRVGGSDGHFLRAWPGEHQRRWPSFDYRNDDGSIHFLGHTRTYLRSPRPDLHIDIVIRAIHAYHGQQRSRFKEAIAHVLEAPASQVRELAVAGADGPKQVVVWTGFSMAAFNADQVADIWTETTGRPLTAGHRKDFLARDEVAELVEFIFLNGTDWVREKASVSMEEDRKGLKVLKLSEWLSSCLRPD